MALSDMAKVKSPKKESTLAILARITKEMKRPRFAASARKKALKESR
jgi:hypothetical protein